jgi:hypothetical protein
MRNHPRKIQVSDPSPIDLRAKSMSNTIPLAPGCPIDKSLKLIPILPGTKRPLFKGWQRGAKPLHEWQAALPEWATWAMPCGPVNDVWVLDVDPKHGGDVSLLDLTSEHEGFKRPHLTNTPSGGFHVRFKWTESCQRLTSTAGVLGPGLDVRADGAYVLCPPTAGYVTRFELSIEPAPEWLMELLLAPKVRAAGAVGAEGVSVRHPKAYADAAVTHALAEIADAREGQRNHTLNRNAFGLGKLLGSCGLDYDKVLEVLVDAAIESGMPAYEALDTARRGLTAGAASV